VVPHIPLALAVVLAVGDCSGLLHEEIGTQFGVCSDRDHDHDPYVAPPRISMLRLRVACLSDDSVLGPALERLAFATPIRMGFKPTLKYATIDFGGGGNEMSSETAKDSQSENWNKIGLTPWSLIDVFRFVIALVLIVGFLYIVYICLTNGYATLEVVAGVFSGWILAVITFYFMDQAAGRTQQQAEVITKRAEGKASSIAQASDEATFELETKAKAKITELEHVKNEALRLVASYDKRLDEVLGVEKGTKLRDEQTDLRKKLQQLQGMEFVEGRGPTYEIEETALKARSRIRMLENL